MTNSTSQFDTVSMASSAVTSCSKTSEARGYFQFAQINIKCDCDLPETICSAMIEIYGKSKEFDNALFNMHRGGINNTIHYHCTIAYTKSVRDSAMHTIKKRTLKYIRENIDSNAEDDTVTIEPKKAKAGTQLKNSINYMFKRPLEGYPKIHSTEDESKLLKEVERHICKHFWTLTQEEKNLIYKEDMSKDKSPKNKLVKYQEYEFSVDSHIVDINKEENNTASYKLRVELLNKNATKKTIKKHLTNAIDAGDVLNSQPLKRGTKIPPVNEFLSKVMEVYGIDFELHTRKLRVQSIIVDPFELDMEYRPYIKLLFAILIGQPVDLRFYTSKAFDSAVDYMLSPSCVIFPYYKQSIRYFTFGENKDIHDAYLDNYIKDEQEKDVFYSEHPHINLHHSNNEYEPKEFDDIMSMILMQSTGLKNYEEIKKARRYLGYLTLGRENLPTEFKDFILYAHGPPGTGKSTFFYILQKVGIGCAVKSDTDFDLSKIIAAFKCMILDETHKLSPVFRKAIYESASSESNATEVNSKHKDNQLKKIPTPCMISNYAPKKIIDPFTDSHCISEAETILNKVYRFKEQEMRDKSEQEPLTLDFRSIIVPDTKIKFLAKRIHDDTHEDDAIKLIIKEYYKNEVNEYNVDGSFERRAKTIEFYKIDEERRKHYDAFFVEYSLHIACWMTSGASDLHEKAINGEEDDNSKKTLTGKDLLRALKTDLIKYSKQ